jgi:hypothetical protein
MNRKIPNASSLQARVNMRQFLAGRHMKEDSYGTLDVSLEWPLTPTLDFKNDVQGTGGFLFQHIVSPKPGFHSLLTNLFIDTLLVFAGDSFELRLTPAGSNTGLAALTYQVVTRSHFWPARTNYAVIGGIAIEEPANGGIAVGARPVYVPENWSLDMVYFSPGGEINIRSQYYEFPASQPLTSLLSL